MSVETSYEDNLYMDITCVCRVSVQHAVCMPTSKRSPISPPFFSPHTKTMDNRYWASEILLTSTIGTIVTRITKIINKERPFISSCSSSSPSCSSSCFFCLCLDFALYLLSFTYLPHLLLTTSIYLQSISNLPCPWSLVSLSIRLYLTTVYSIPLKSVIYRSLLYLSPVYL